MTNSSLVVIEDTPYSVTVRQDQINSLGDALMSYHPEAQKAGVAVMRNVAALALATGANPLPGGLNGIHVWDNKGKIAVSLGEGFWSGLTKNYGGVVWMFRPRPMTEQERNDWAVMPGDIAFICAGCLGHHLRDHIRESVNSGIPITRAEAKEELCQYGTAVVKQTDYEKAGRSRGWTAGKRAEVALFKKLVPAGAINQNRRVAPDGRVLGGEGWDVAEFVKPTLPANTENKAVDEINGELYGETPTETDGETIIGETVTMPESQPDAQTSGMVVSVMGVEIDPKKIWYSGLNPHEKEVYKAPERFAATVMTACPHYKALPHIEAALKLFSIGGVPDGKNNIKGVPNGKNELDGRSRVDLLQKLITYGTARDAGLGSETAVNKAYGVLDGEFEQDDLFGDMPAPAKYE